jgi:hypothetical protein
MHGFGSDARYSNDIHYERPLACHKIIAHDSEFKPNNALTFPKRTAKVYNLPWAILSQHFFRYFRLMDHFK